MIHIICKCIQYSNEYTLHELKKNYAIHEFAFDYFSKLDIISNSVSLCLILRFMDNIFLFNVEFKLKSIFV